MPNNAAPETRHRSLVRHFRGWVQGPRSSQTHWRFITGVILGAVLGHDLSPARLALAVGTIILVALFLSFASYRRHALALEAGEDLNATKRQW